MKKLVRVDGDEVIQVDDVVAVQLLENGEWEAPKRKPGPKPKTQEDKTEE